MFGIILNPTTTSFMFMYVYVYVCLNIHTYIAPFILVECEIRLFFFTQKSFPNILNRDHTSKVTDKRFEDKGQRMLIEVLRASKNEFINTYRGVIRN